MPFVKSVSVDWTRVGDAAEHPFDIPAISALGTLALDAPVTFFVGENGTGKSTLLEALAVHRGLNAEGGSQNMRFATRSDSVSALHACLELLRAPRHPQDQFFLRAESYFNVATAIEDYDVQRSYGDESPHRRSHGESFIDLVVHRFSPNGLYFLDEPEAALSIHGQFRLLAAMHELVEAGTQFVIATHSPVLMAYPTAVIYEFGDDGLTQVDWEDVDTVSIMRSFLEAPQRVLEVLFADD